MGIFKKRSKNDIKLYFEPKEDLTAYELTCMPGVLLWGTKNFVSTQDEWTSLLIKCPGIERHFKVEYYNTDECYQRE